MLRMVSRQRRLLCSGPQPHHECLYRHSTRATQASDCGTSSPELTKLFIAAVITIAGLTVEIQSLPVSAARQKAFHSMEQVQWLLFLALYLFPFCWYAILLVAAEVEIL